MDHSFLLHSVALLIVMFSFSFLGATTGGSSFLTVPACIFFGFAPSEAIATTRVGVLGSSAAGWHGFKNKAKVNTKIGVRGAVFASCGAILGAYFMISLLPAVLQRGLGVLTLIILVLTLLRKRCTNSLCIPSH
jgi:uncharacterized membrane protein YfcA